MAAGDVTIQSDSGRAFGKNYRVLSGTVILDGGNPTPVALAAYLREVLGGVVSLGGSVAPGVDPSAVSCAASTTNLNVYAWKVTGTGDCTLIASTDNARVVHWTAWGRR